MKIYLSGNSRLGNTYIPSWLELTRGEVTVVYDLCGDFDIDRGLTSRFKGSALPWVVRDGEEEHDLDGFNMPDNCDLLYSLCDFSLHPLLKDHDLVRIGLIPFESEEVQYNESEEEDEFTMVKCEILLDENTYHLRDIEFEVCL